MSLPDTTRIPATRESADGAVFYVVVCTATDGTQYAVEKRYSQFNVLRTYVESDNKATILEFPKKTMRKGTSSKTVAKRMTGLADWLTAVLERCRQNEAIALNEERAGLSLGGSSRIVLTAAVAQFLEPTDGAVSAADLAEIGLVLTNTAPTGGAAGAAAPQAAAAPFKRDYPLSPDEVSIEFLSKCLGAPVASFECDTSMIDGGVLADAFRVTITYNTEDPSSYGKPPSVFFKCTKSIEGIVALSTSTDVYRKEIYFYEELHKRIRPAVRVPQAFGCFYDKNDPDCKEFCLVLEEFVQEEFSGFDQKDHPMTLEDVGPYLDDLAALHASCWDTPIEDKPGLRDYAAHWGSLDAQFPQMWGIMEAEYEATFGHTLWAEVTEEEGAAVKELSGLLAGEHGPKINAALLARFRSRPRSITHGDARGQNVFREKAGERKFALIDWQMWVAGPVAYEFNQVWMNSFDPGSGVTERFEELMAQYHATLVRLEPRAAEYTLETLLADVKLQLCTIWMQYVGFTCGMLAGYKDPANAGGATNWNMLMTRNCTTLRNLGCLDAMKEFVAQEIDGKKGSKMQPLGGTKTRYMTRSTDTTPASAGTELPGAPTPVSGDAAEITRRAFLQDRYPKVLEDVTKEWISALMKQPVAKVTATQVLEAGVTSDAAIFALEYAPGGSGPPSVCVKYAKGNESNRVFAQGGMMYEKEIMFYQQLESVVSASGMPIPGVIAVFVDPEKPKEFFCIVMDDMGIDHDAMDQIKGITLNEQKELVSVACKLHAAFWDHPVLKHPTICNGKPEACNIFFQGWAEVACTKVGAIENYQKLAIDKCDSDPFPTDRHMTMVRLWQQHSVALLEHFHEALDSRPFTMCHGDMRSDNLFQRKDKTGYRVIDWQTFGCSPPGVEMHQLMGASMANLEDYDQLPAILRKYLTELHSMCPAARSYTFDMLWYDFRVCGAVGQICFADVLGGMLADLPVEHPNMALFKQMLPRYARCYANLDIVGLTLDAARELGLTATAATPAPAPPPVSTGAQLERAAFMQKHYPKNGVEEVTKEWLSALLGEDVSSMTYKVLDAGVTADAAIFNLEFATPPDGSVPSSLVLKYAKMGDEGAASRVLAQDAQMYEKEVFFYDSLHGTVAGVMPIPDVIQVFRDPEKPKEFFCIAMEDLSVDFKPMDQTKGITWQQACDLATSVAKLHATFWEHDVLQQPTVCGGDPEKAAIGPPSKFDCFYTNMKGPLVNVDWCPTDAHKNVIRLWKAHGQALLDECNRIMTARPFTLIHGDLRSDNLFEGKDPASGYKFIDWQSYAAGPPGMEMVQFLAGSISPTDDLDHMDKILEVYLTTLHDSQPAARSYTMAMLKEDFTISFTLLYYGVSDPFGPFFVALPADHPLWIMFKAISPRYIKCCDVLDVCGYMQRMADRLGLKVDPNLPFFGDVAEGVPEGVPPNSLKQRMSRSTDTQRATPAVSDVGSLATVVDASKDDEDVATSTRRMFLQDNYPKCVEDVTQEWLSALMEQPVSRVSVIKVLEAGVTSDAAIFALEYAPGGSGPPSVCVKYAKGMEASREFAQGGMMYEKEIMFYQELEQMVAQGGMPIPGVIAVFVDPEKPKEFFCIVMDDMGIDHDAMDQIKGVTYDEQCELVSLAVKLHSTFWEHPILNHPTVCSGETEKCTLFFQGWLEGAVADPTSFQRYRDQSVIKLGVDPLPSENEATMFKLWEQHSVALLEHFHKVIDSRPRTMCHGDMRSDNLFQRKDKSGYRVIDWQTYSASPPGVEMHQLLGASMSNLEDYEQIETILRQ